MSRAVRIADRIRVHLLQEKRVRWSFPLGRVFGIPIRVHVTFFLLLAFVYWEFSGRSQSRAGGLFAVLLVCIIFTCVVAHELGHSLTARLFGTRTRGIVILPIGGVALLEHIPREAYREILIALAGPVVSVITAGLFLALAAARGCSLDLGSTVIGASPDNLTVCSLLVSLFWINAILAIFNLVPAFPMDGGRVFRGVSSLLFGYEQGTQLASRLGQFLAILFILSGALWLNHWGLILVGFFIYFGASEEERVARLRSSIEGATVEQAMIRSFQTLSPHDTLLDALAKSVSADQGDFPVLEDGRLVGMAASDRLVEGIKHEGLEAHVATVMAEEFPCASPESDLESLSMEVMRRGRRAIPVLRGGELVGMITWEQIVRFGSIRREVRQATRAVEKGGKPTEVRP
jgi:Zn-dependent protease/predicted transcriptional regulator